MGSGDKSDGDSTDSTAIALASVSMCEALMIALLDGGILDEDEIRSALEDAISAHRQARTQGTDPDLHDRTAKIIERVLVGGNGVKGHGPQRK